MNYGKHGQRLDLQDQRDQLVRRVLEVFRDHPELPVPWALQVLQAIAVSPGQLALQDLAESVERTLTLPLCARKSLTCARKLNSYRRRPTAPAVPASNR